MNSNDEMQTFLRDGLQRYYADAKDSVATFETEIQERLMRLFEVKPDWSNFHPRRERRRVNALHAGLAGDVGRPQIWAWTCDEKGNSIELGIEWGTHETRRPILYTELGGAGSHKLYLSDPKAPVQNHVEGYLFVIVGDGFELEPMARLLLDETDRALADVKPVKGRRPDAATS